MLKQKSTEMTLLDLPDDLIKKIGQFSSTPELAALAGTSKRLNYLLQPELETNRAAKQLMEYVLFPTEENIKKAKAMVAANPQIMFIETEGYEKASGIEETLDDKGQIRTRAVYRKIKGTPFQATLGTGDSELYNDMAKYFDKIVYKDEDGKVIETGVERAQRQIQEKFPNGFDYPPSDYDFTPIINAIANDQTLIATGEPSAATQAILAQFRKDFLPNDVTQGHHFNLNHLIKAFEVYDQNWHTWNGKQLSLFWCQAIGYLEHQVTVVDAQAFCQGLYCRLEQNQPQARSLSLYNYQSTSDSTYYPLNSSAAGLGFDFGIEIYGLHFTPGRARRPIAESFGRTPWTGSSRACLKNYVEQKNQSLITLDNKLSNELTKQPESGSKQCLIL